MPLCPSSSAFFPRSACGTRLAALARQLAPLAAAALVGALAAPAHAQAVTFTYQGQLSDNGQPADGVYDFQFSLFNQPSGGSLVSSTYCANDITVTDGLFTVELPLVIPPPSTGVFLNIAVRAGAVGTCGSNTGFQLLTPRQPLSRAPAATYAAAIGDFAPAITGAMRYNQALARIEFFDGVFWHAIATVDDTNLITPPNVRTFFAPGTFNFAVPAGVTSLIVQIHGGGGGGAGLGPGSTSLPPICLANQGAYAAGGGGGSAGRGASFAIDVTPGEVLNIVVGNGGGGGINATGTAGQPSRIRRGDTDIVLVPGGFPGTRANNPVVLASDSAPNLCQGAFGGIGGSVPSEPTLTGPGRLIENYNSGPGGVGEGPSCNGSITPTFCAASGGRGGRAAEGLFTSGAGEGGDGAGATTAAQNGNPGKVVLYWY